MNTQTTQLIANDINEITLLVARAVKSLTANGYPIRDIAIHQAPRRQWVANIAYTETTHKAADADTETRIQSPVPNLQPPVPQFIRLTDLAARCYYNHEHARKLCVELGITLHRARGSGRPHCLSAEDAHRFAAAQCPGVRIHIDDALFALEEDLDEDLALAA